MCRTQYVEVERTCHIGRRSIHQQCCTYMPTPQQTTSPNWKAFTSAVHENICASVFRQVAPSRLSPFTTSAMPSARWNLATDAQGDAFVDNGFLPSPRCHLLPVVCSAHCTDASLGVAHSDFDPCICGSFSCDEWIPSSMLPFSVAYTLLYAHALSTICSIASTLSCCIILQCRRQVSYRIHRHPCRLQHRLPSALHVL